MFFSEAWVYIYMINIGNFQEIRERVDKALEIPDYDAWRLYFPAEFPGEVSFEKGPDYSDLDCIDYALGIKYPRNKGVNRLLILPDTVEPKKGDIVLYLNNEKDSEIWHAGRVQEDGKIISKFGSGGPLFRHPVTHVPTHYGNFAVFKTWKKDSSIDHLLQKRV
jgi:hypothetical protein